MDTAPPLRLALHLPLAVTLLTVGLTALLVVETVEHSASPAIRHRDAALLVALALLTVQLAAWHLVGWGF
jgi:hypothetical protein